MKGNLVNS